MLALALVGLPALGEPAAVHRHAIAMHGEPALPPGFAHFPYANPDAPKGGTLRLGRQGSFDTLNSMTVVGNAPPILVPYIVQPLMMRSADEPFTLYGLLAESVAVPDDRSFVEFRLDSRARFSDGAPVTAEDVRFTWELFSTRGRPNYRRLRERIREVRVSDPRTIRFVFRDGSDRELPLILAMMPVLAAHATDPERFERTGFQPFLGSGAYALESLDPGSRIVLVRREGYWGKDLPSQRGHHNAERIQLEYFRDSNTLFEAFKTGAIDFRPETDPTKWQTGYDFPALRDGRVVREAVPNGAPKGMSGFVFNTRRAPFDDPRVREAMLAFFDFEWLNRNLFGGVYRRTGSFFDESELAFRGHPASPAERARLAALNVALPASVLEGRWAPPRSDGSGRDRRVMRAGVARLAEAGFAVRNGEMVGARDGRPFAFEILVTTREKERVALAFADGLAQVGIRPRIRLVDASEYWARLRRFEFDAVLEGFVVGASPGQEQANRWSSRAAGVEGTLNWAGVRSPAVDAAIADLLAARDRPAFVESVRLLDRLLIAGHYVLPLYHLPDRWFARWAHLKRPERVPAYDLITDVFWIEPNR